MRTAAFVVSACALVLLTAVRAPAGETPCVGDCNGDGRVAINELILGVNISLGSQPIDACQAFDCMNTGTVPITCLIQGVNNSLNGCNGDMTPTPTMTPTTGGTERVFTIGRNEVFLPGGGCNDCDNQQASCIACMSDSDCPDGQECSPSADGISRTGLFNGSPLANTNAAMVFAPGPLTLVLGPQGEGGIASLSMKEDVVLFADVFGGAGCFCLKLFAAGSGGELDCDGGTAYDTQIFQPVGQSAGWDVTLDLGDPAGPGNGNLLVDGQILFVPAMTCEAVDCPNATYPDPPVQFPFTTTNAIALKGTTLRLTNRGEAFSCENFATPNSGGALVAGGAITIDPVGDTADSIRFSE